MNITNFIQFESDDIENAKGKGLISTLDRDMDITVVPFASEKPNAPTHRVYSKSPRGYDIEVGAIWKRKNKEDGGEYLNLSIKRLGYQANLGRMAGQDDPALQAVIEWEPRRD